MITTRGIKDKKEDKVKVNKFVTTKTVEAKTIDDPDGERVPAGGAFVTTHNIHIHQAEVKKRRAAEVKKLADHKKALKRVADKQRRAAAKKKKDAEKKK